MSTRCQIAFYDKRPKVGDLEKGKWEALLYRHSDGYPEQVWGNPGRKCGVLVDIKPFLRRWLEIRGWDPQYCAARMLQMLCNRYDENQREYEREAYKKEGRGYKRGEQRLRVLGYGVCRRLHLDIEYLYVIYGMGKGEAPFNTKRMCGVDVYDVRCKDWDNPEGNWVFKGIKTMVVKARAGGKEK